MDGEYGVYGVKFNFQIRIDFLIHFICCKLRDVGREILPINIINILIQISNVNKYIKYLSAEGSSLQQIKKSLFVLFSVWSSRPIFSRCLLVEL